MTGRQERRRLRVEVRGMVQGVGFRPFVYRLALAMGMDGWVRNAPSGVFIEVEGLEAAFAEFLARLEREKPALASIASLEHAVLEPAGLGAFRILESEQGGEKAALILPDIAPCPDCLRELFDPADRRFRYPFLNCTHCGPRFTVVEALPYDRSRTTMKGFVLCPACRAEYGDPADRRFHAQPTACPACGPRLTFQSPAGEPAADGEEALQRALAVLKGGGTVGLKGVGGFQLLCDARSHKAVAALRKRKGREEKPFALLFPTLGSVRDECEVAPLEAFLLAGPQAPIVLLRRREETRLTPLVAPNNPHLGVMLPASPLHHLLAADLGFPLVATSGNRSDEPICIDEREAVERLGPLCDGFLVHDRPIARHADDSIVRVMAGREVVLRRARGYAPLPVRVPAPLPKVLAAGGHLKSTVAFAIGADVFLSQHLGDLDTAPAFEVFKETVAALPRLYDFAPALAACDGHPDYASAQHARSLGLPVAVVQHHAAHLLACAAENAVEPPFAGIVWDGTGWGPDGTVWGGEFFRFDGARVTRAGRFRPFPLPGGDAAVREPRRSALGALWAMGGGEAFSPDLAPVQAFGDGELAVLAQMLSSGLRSPLASSAGRLFDAAAALAGLRQVNRFEGQAAMELEFAAARFPTEERYPVAFRQRPAPAFGAPMPLLGQPPELFELDWKPLLLALIGDLRRPARVGLIAARFHNGLAEAAVEAAKKLGEPRVILSGGCFQNRLLLERTVARLEAEGFEAVRHQRVPPNDGGIALGQAVAAGLIASKGKP
jgi:hydrogenase maturation protein HypF